MYYSFSAQDAMKYGVNEAIVLDHVRKSIHFNKSINQSIFDGKAWMRGNIESLSYEFSFWSDAQIRRALNSLVHKGALIKANHNERLFNRTLWYTLTEGDEL